MLRKIHGTNFFHIKLLDRTNIKCQNGPVLPPAHVFYFKGLALCMIFQTQYFFGYQLLLIRSGHHTRHREITYLL
jgi:hypothetical protein